MKEENLNDKLRQKVKGGPYYYRLMVANGLRKEFALKTSDYDERAEKPLIWIPFGMLLIKKSLLHT